ncbi:amino acid ABC transporter substrate-binding protein [Solicola sp. PLA-1-18]|uniref:amino acid ABC transporter substrate-binding protein n=1 Tax=Solicola sp. PLA-1-18 TaxID=3380532 RepID=UPI003B8149DE
MTLPLRTWTAALAAATCVLSLAACGGVKTASDDRADADTVVIGASIPLSGDLAGFGGFQKWGYERAVKEVNDAGGIDVGGTKVPVELKLLDDKTDPNQVTSNTQALISDDKAVALLGSCTPALVIPGAIAAENAKIPFVTGCAPEGAFTSAKKWTYAWDLFFSEADLATTTFETISSSGVQTNKKVAILHDNGPDGKVVGGTIWPAEAKKNGFQVVATEEFPTQNSDFSAAVQKAKASGADVVLVDAVTPQAVSIRKQMATAGYDPTFLVMEKGAEPQQFADALGNLSDGVLVGGYWDPSLPYPGAAELGKAYTDETGKGFSQHIADSYTAAKVLLDAIAKAGSTEPAEVNKAVGATDAQYPVGPVKFDDKNFARLNIVELQWQDGKTQVVHPEADQTAKLIAPVPQS